MIKTNKQLRRHLGSGAVSASEESGRILAYLPEGRRVCVGVLGQVLYDKLTGWATELGEVVWPDATADEMKQVYELAERVEGMYIYLAYLPLSVGTDTDSGLQELDSKNTAPTRLTVLNERKEGVAKLAGEAMEDLLQYLFEHVAKVDGWETTDAFAAANLLLIRTGQELGVALPPSKGSYRVFYAMRNWLLEAERVLLGSLPNVLIADLRDKRKDDGMSDKQKSLLGFLQRSVAWAAFLDALPHLVIQQTDGGLRILTEFDGLNSKLKPSLEQFEILRASVERKRDIVAAELQDFLLKEFAELFPTQRGMKPNFLKKDYKRIFSM